MATIFDFETALKQLQSAQALTGENGIVTPLIKGGVSKSMLTLNKSVMNGKRKLNQRL